jgi:hypothetical protein
VLLQAAVGGDVLRTHADDRLSTVATCNPDSHVFAPLSPTTLPQYVSTCFCNGSLFHKALKEAFEAFCNKNVAGSSSAELMASFCDNLLKKVRWLGVQACVLGWLR